jgi:signal transduction histidine kinase
MATEIKNFSEEELVSVSGGISKSAQSIYNLLENLLEWSRIKTGRIPYDPVVFALKEVVDRIIAIYKSNLESKNISLSVDVNPSLYVFADVNSVETILRNLISNAIKFTDSSGKISLQVIEKDTIVEINIKDSGVGIADDIIPKLFKIDENVSSDGTRKEHGSGLGLILCKEFVEMNKGKLTFTTKVGEGSTFSFTLQKK